MDRAISYPEHIKVLKNVQKKTSKEIFMQIILQIEQEMWKEKVK